jgi:hypothetical protein
VIDLQSISPISKLFQTTGSSPVMILCNDVNDYVCKYPKSNPASDLFNEYIAVEFLRTWQLRVPDAALIDIKPEHVPTDFISNTIQPIYFRKPCFGSKYSAYAKDIDPSIGVIRDDAKMIRKIRDKSDLLKIALFDLWMANEDRNHNNYNLLLSTEPDFYFLPIDHEKCLNSNSLAPNRGLVMLTEEETLINTDLAKLTFRNSKSLKNEIDEIIVNYYLWVSECQNSLENIVNAMPEQWGIAKETKIALLNSSLFHENWIAECEETFKDYTTRFLLS